MSDSDNAEPKVTRRKVSDYTPDHKNANRGTERGQYMIDRSVETVGLARSIVAAADGTIPAGNKTLQAAEDAGITDVIEVETDGKTLVVVKRSDWDTVDNDEARRYAYLDNRAAQVGLDWDVEQLLADVNVGVDLGDMFRDWELASLVAPSDDEWGLALENLPDGDRAPFQQMTFTLHDDQADVVRAALLAAKDGRSFDDSPNENSNGNALAAICGAFVNGSR